MSMFLEHTNNSNSSMIYFIYTRSLLLFYVPEVLREDPRLPIRFALYYCKEFRRKSSVQVVIIVITNSGSTRGLYTRTYYHETDGLPNPRPTQPEKESG